MKKKLSLFLAVLLSVALCVQAAAVSGWEMHGSSGSAASVKDIQAFLNGLTGEYVVNMQVRYELGKGLPVIPNTLVDKSYYDELAALLKPMKLSSDKDAVSAGEPSGSVNRLYLTVTTQQNTVSFCGAGSVVYVRGSLGSGTFAVSKSDVRALSDAIGGLPGVAKAYQEALRTQSQADVASVYRSELDEAGEIIGYGRELIKLRGVNPEALCVDYDTIDTIQIFDGDRYFVRVSEQADRYRLCNLVNAVVPGSMLEREKSSRDEIDGLRLEFRMKDGSKHEYQLDASTDNLNVDGKLYSDRRIVRVFGAVLGDAYYRYPTRAAWLGYMNTRRMLNITVYTGTGTTVYNKQNYPNKIEQISNELKGIRVYDYIPYRPGKLPAEVKDRAPTTSYTIAFDGGAVYNVARYGEDFLSVEWVGQQQIYLYRLQ